MDSTGAADSQSSPGQPGHQASSRSDRIALLESRIDSIEGRLAANLNPHRRELPRSTINPADRGPWWKEILPGLADFGKDCSLLPRVFTDPRYPLPWHIRVGVPVLAVLFFFSAYLMPLGLASLPIVGKIPDLFIAGLFFWLIWREVRRYRRVSEDLPDSWRV